MRTVSDFLHVALKRLQTRNRKASIRSVASQIKRSPSYVSKLFRNERPLPLKMVPALAKVLQMDHHEISEIQRMILREVEQRQLKDATGIRTLEKSTAAVAD